MGETFVTFLFCAIFYDEEMEFAVGGTIPLQNVLKRLESRLVMDVEIVFALLGFCIGVLVGEMVGKWERSE